MKAIPDEKKKSKYGQYFTPENIAEYMVGLSSAPKDSFVMDPCCGEGVFLKALEKSGFVNITAFEIDPTLDNPYEYVRIESYVSADTDKTFDLIIGNPPYIRWKNLEDELKSELQSSYLWKKYCNSLCDYLYIFIIKSIFLLKEGGELIFICPEYWMNTTHSKTLREFMINNGYFTDIIHFSESSIFSGVNSSIMIFRYVKGKKTISTHINVVKFNNRIKIDDEILDALKQGSKPFGAEVVQIPQFNKNEQWIIINEKDRIEIESFEKSCRGNTIGKYCDIGNGMVSGLDHAFRLSDTSGLNDIEMNYVVNVVKGKDTKPYVYSNTTPYIFLPDELTEEYLMNKCPNIRNHLLHYREKLDERYNYGRNIPYWNWAFPRNYKLLSLNVGKIFTPSKERVSHKSYFRFVFADPGVLSTQDVTAIVKKPEAREKIEYILAFLNTPQVFQWVSYKGVIKGNIIEFSEAPISRIPFRPIDWKSRNEVEIHDEIVNLTSEIIAMKDEPQVMLSNIPIINELFNKLLALNVGKVPHGQTRLSDHY